MYIIIDGYNVLHTAKLIQRSLSEQQLIQQVITYHKKRGHHIVLVFDAGNSMYESEKYESGITIIYSGQYQTADTAIIRYIEEKLQNKETLLVSSDNMLCQTAHKYHVPAIDSELFYKIMVNRINEHNEMGKTHRNQKIIKYSSEKNDLFDKLMAESAPPDKDSAREIEEYFLKNVDRKSKIDKKMLAILQKL